MLDLDTRLANVLFDRMAAIENQLRDRGARLALCPLLDDADRFVSFYTAEALLGLVPDKSRAILERNAKYWDDLLAADARGTLRDLDAGRYKPD